MLLGDISKTIRGSDDPAIYVSDLSSVVTEDTGCLTDPPNSSGELFTQELFLVTKE